jgi:hypothetical protein
MVLIPLTVVVMPPLILHGLLSLLCCTEHEPILSEMVVESAHLEGFSLGTYAFFGGRSEGSAWLFVTDDEGNAEDYFIGIHGWVAGFGLELDVEMAAAPVQLRLPDKELHPADLLGLYRGHSEALVFGAGVDTHHLENGQGVQLDTPALALGVGVMAEREWLSFQLEDEDEMDTGGSWSLLGGD